ncbi:MAG: hypothetical protein K2K55_05940, partial [Duncaniella sp.]|nr:hypothetical protein [Duncaniella sp.]
MRFPYAFSLLILTVFPAASATLIWESPLPVYEADVPSQSGLDAIGVANGLDGVKAVLPLSSPGSVTVTRFGQSGAAYGEQITSGVTVGSAGITLTGLKGDCGYMVEWAGGSYKFWICDYSAHRLSLASVSPSAEQDNCSLTALDVAGTGDEIAYYGITGRRFTLSRDIEVSYLTQIYSDDSDSWVDSPVAKKFDALS